MDRVTFKQHLRLATEVLLPFMRSMVVNHLPDDCRYLVSLSSIYYRLLLEKQSSHLGQAFTQPVNGFSQDSREQGLVRSLNVADVAELLCEDGEVPVWINMEVHSAYAEFTHIKLECSGRLTSHGEGLYHIDEGYPPFHVLSGYLPSGWKSVEQSGKFDLRDTSR